MAEKKYLTKTIDDLHENEKMFPDLVVDVKYVPLDIGSIVILKSLNGVHLDFAIDKIAPAVAIKLGLVPELCRFFIHEPLLEINERFLKRENLPVQFDDTFIEILVIGGMKIDDYGHVYASSIQRAKSRLETSFLLEHWLGAPLSKNIGKVGLFVSSTSDIKEFEIAAYDGTRYYYKDEHGNLCLIEASLVGFN